MSALTDIFKDGSKVVISPDQMRAWVTLAPPENGVKYTAAAIKEWLPENGVVYGVDSGLVSDAVDSEKYHELLEVARGKPALAAQAGSYTLKIDKKPFTGLKGNSDGSLFYDDLSFLQEAQPDQILAEVIAAVPGAPGMTVTGEEVVPKAAEDDKALKGTGFVVTDEGRYYRAPVLSHVSIVNEELVVTPLLKIESLAEEDGPVNYEGNVLVEKDVMAGASITATGSIFVAGRAVAANFKAGNNLLLCRGIHSQGGFGHAEAKENIWGEVFESAEIKAGGDFCTTYLQGCEVTAGGRASILGGRGSIVNTQLYAKNGVIAVQIGDNQDTETVISAGIDADMIEQFETIEKKLTKMAMDVQALQHNMTAYERVNRSKADKGMNDAQYKEMKTKKEQMLSIVNILNGKRTRMKRTIDQFSNVSITVRGTVYPGVTIVIDTRSMNILKAMNKVKFKRSQDVIETISGSSR